jgi:hypothetical protein
MKNIIKFLALITTVILIHSCKKENNPVLPTQGLVAYYPFNGNANDESSNNNDGTVYSATLTTDRKGNSNKAYYFNGNSRIEVLDNPIISLSPEQFTITTWVKLNAFSSDGGYYLMGQSEGPGDTRKWIFFVANNGLSFVMTNSGGGWITLGSIAFNLEEWYFLAIIRNGNSLSAYVNGNSIGTASVGIATPDINTLFYIGTAESGHPNRVFKGTSDDIRIYNRALSETEIQQLYNE